MSSSQVDASAEGGEAKVTDAKQLMTGGQADNVMTADNTLVPDVDGPNQCEHVTVSVSAGNLQGFLLFPLRTFHHQNSSSPSCQ